MYENIKKVCLYVRYSSSNQTEQSIEGQVRVCTQFCKTHNMQIVDIYADRATSASKDIEKRTEFLRMIKESDKHPFQAVIVYKLDRFARTRYDMATYKFRLKKNGVQLISATENISDNPEGIILESVLEGMAEFYSAELSQKINRGMKESAYKNNYIGGTVPLGYKVINKKYVIDEKTSPFIVEAFTRFANGETIASICKSFNERGIRTSLGKKFGKSSFAKIFRNEKYIGAYQYKDYKDENAIPPIINKELWNKVQSRLKTRLPSGTYKAKTLYLLSGKLYCGKCGSRMFGGRVGGEHSKGKKRLAYYMCSGKKTLRVDCNMKYIRKDYIEPVILGDALSMLTDKNIEIIAEAAVQENQYELETTTNIPTLKTRLAEIQTSLENLTKAIESGDAPEMLVKRMIELEKEKKSLNDNLKLEEKYIPKHIDKDHIIFWLENLKSGNIEDEEFQKQLIDLFINSVTITPDNEPNNYTINIVYNLTELPSKTIKSGFGFDPKTSSLEIKSEYFIHRFQTSLSKI